MEEAGPYLIKTSRASFYRTSTHLTQLHQLGKKIHKINKLIHPATGKYFFHNKITKTVLPIVETMMGKIEQEVKAAHRLPFNPDGEWQRYQLKIEQELGVGEQEETGVESTTINTEALQTHVFHLLADSYDHKKLEKMDVSDFEGSNEVRSTLSFSQILKQLVQNADEESKPRKQFLLDQINKTHQVALKTTYLFHMEEDRTINSQVEYFKQLSKLERLQAKGKTCEFLQRKGKFDELYRLSQKRCSVPYFVLVNDVAHDILQRIDSIKPGDMRIFSAGTRRHRVLVQIKRLEPTSSFPHGEFLYTIINAGDGIRSYHQIKEVKNNGIFVKPLTFKKLTRSAFTYSFIEKLVSHALTSQTTIPDFYSFHKAHLIDTAKGVYDYNGGEYMKSQSFGTCSYAAFERWIDSCLSEEEVIEKEEVKTALALKKQDRVIQVLKKEISEPKWTIMQRNKPNVNQRLKKVHIPTKESERKQRQLKANVKLRKLGQAYQQSLEKKVQIIQQSVETSNNNTNSSTIN